MRRAVQWGMLVGALFGPATARAQEAPPPSATAARDAQARFEEGLARVKSGDFEAARASFAQAYAVLPTPSIVWNLALAEEKTHRPLEALAHFKEYLRPMSPRDPDRTRTQKHIDDLSATTGHIAVVASPGAVITVDSVRSAGVAPRADTIDVMPGRHVVEVKLGSDARTLAVDAVAGQTVRADFQGGAALAPSVPGATSPQPAGDGTEPPAPPPGDRPASGGVSTARLVTVTVVGGVAVVAAGLGLGFGIASSQEASTSSGLRSEISSCPASPPAGSLCQKLASNVSAQHSNHVASTGLWVTSAVLAAADVGLWFLWPKALGSAGARGSIQVVPGAGAASAGVVALGSF